MLNRTLSVTSVSGVLLTLVLAAPVEAATGQTTPAPAAASASDLLAQSRHGQRAVTALGDDLDVAAARNDMRPAELRSLLLADTTAWVDPDGRVYFIDAVPARVPSAGAVAEAAPFPYDQTFLLHSNTGSNRVIYLDFDGHVVSGTQWNSSQGVSTAAQPAFDTDGSPGSFSNAERDTIQSVWQRVSEDYAPFDVDVTTQDPGVDALARTGSGDLVYGTRALITPSTQAQTAICGGPTCGGVAYIGTYDSTSSGSYQPAWVFPQSLGNGAKAIAEAVSHEVGHNLGLNHDGTSAVGYYAGHGSWAPIMGVGYNRPITQWSRGEYAGANNSEDDLAVIQTNGLAARADDHGATAVTASPMSGSVPLVATGTISTRSDADWFQVDRGCTGTFTATATPAPVSPDLDIRLRLRASDGAVLSTADPVSGSASSDQATGLSASVNQTLGSGVFYLDVDGIGALDPASTGYSDYASVGTYGLSVTGCTAGSTPPGAATIGQASPGAVGGKISATARWTPPTSDGGSAITGYRVTALRLNAAGAVVGTTVSNVQPATARLLAMTLPRTGRYTFTVVAINAVGSGVASARSNVVNGR